MVIRAARRASRAPIVIAVTLVGVLALVAFQLFVGSAPQDRDALIAAARRAAGERDHTQARRLADQILEQNPGDTEALLLAAETAAQLGDIPQAVAYCDKVVQDGSPEAELALWVPCELWWRSKQLTKSEARLRRLLDQYPDHLEGRRRLVYILGMTGRLWEAQSHLFALLQQGQTDFETLLLLGNREDMVDASEQLRAFAAAAPDDPLPQLGLAKIRFKNNDPQEAKKILAGVLRTLPELIEAWVLWGEIIADDLDPKAFQRWEDGLPPDADAHPDVWLVRGDWALRQEQTEVAARQYWEVLRRDPNQRVALYRLSQLLDEVDPAKVGAVDPSHAATICADRHAALSRLARSIQEMQVAEPQAAQIRSTAELCGSLGRWWESLGWYALLIGRGPQTQEPSGEADRKQFVRLREYLTSHSAPRVLPKFDPAAQIDLSALPLRAETSAAPTGGPGELAESVAATIRFADVAAPVGFEFEYFSSPTPGSEGKRIYEFAGGGVAVLDADADGWPDIYMTQGCQWPADSAAPPPGDTVHRNQLFRNVGGRRFENWTDGSGAGDGGFAQGVAVGDFNSDGFADLYVANIGMNRLLINQGDGSFADRSAEVGLSGEHWTTSCLMADFSGDGNPDLYDVNYLQGEDIYTRVCTWQGGKLRICGPATYQSDQDQVWIATEEGHVRNATSTSGVELPGGNGLGIVAADFTDSGRLSLFIANDQMPNFFFVHEQSEGAGLRFRNAAVLAGLAYDRDGAAQACMGVAAGDASGDGRTDLFITNFYQESNTLYVQRGDANSADGTRPGRPEVWRHPLHQGGDANSADGTRPGRPEVWRHPLHQGGDATFADVTRQAGLREASFSMLGFGTQFLDADLDGWLDLVLTNGHLDDFTYLGQPYRMPPQVYRNLGGGRFEPLSAEQLGPFFQGEYRGRGLSRLDWNRDGREDYAISHLDSPAALLENQTHGAGNYLALQLVGVAGARDAIGASVDIIAGEDRWTRQLTAGDGYQASNERALVFGLGRHDRVESVVVRWPGGQRQTFAGMPANSRWLLIEGREQALAVAP